MQFTDLAEVLRSAPHRAFGQGASVSEIEQAQRDLDVRFPLDYIAFLRTFGWGGIESWEIFGLGIDVPPYLNVVEITLGERHKYAPTMPLSLVAIMNDGGGNHYCLDVGSLKNGSCPVVFWDHELGSKQPIQVAVDFTTWLYQCTGVP